MFHNPRAPYITSNNFINFTPNFYTRPYILSQVVPTFFATAPLERKSLLNIDCAWVVVKVGNFQCPIQLCSRLLKDHDFSIKISILLFSTNIK